MKKQIVFLGMLLFLISGCSRRGTQLKEPVLFYYPRAEFDYSEQSSVIFYEEREAAGHSAELPYLLTLYLNGPVEEDLISLFPADTELLHIEQKDQVLIIMLSDTANSLSDSVFSLACACIRLTLSDLVDAESITVTSGSRTVTMHSDSLMLIDDYMPDTTHKSNKRSQT